MSEYHYLFKIIIVGDGRVGKSALLERFCNDIFNENYDVTIGVEFGVRTVDCFGRKCKLQIWDTSGQRNFMGITRSYFRGCSGVLIVFDVTNRASFHSVPKWLEDIRSANPPNETFKSGYSVILVGTKCDDPQQPRQVTRTEAELEAKRLRIDSYIETSSRTGHNVKSTFEELGKNILKNVTQKKIDVNDPLNGVAMGSLKDREEEIVQEREKKHEETDIMDRFSFLFDQFENNDNYQVRLKDRDLEIPRTILFKDQEKPETSSSHQNLQNYSLEKVSRDIIIDFLMFRTDELSKLVTEMESEEFRWEFLRDYFILFKSLGLNKQIFLLYHAISSNPMDEIGFDFMYDLFVSFVRGFENEEVRGCFLDGRLENLNDLFREDSDLKIEAFFDHSLSVLLFQVLVMMLLSIEDNNEKPTKSSLFERIFNEHMDQSIKESINTVDFYKKHEDTRKLYYSTDVDEEEEMLLEELDTIKKIKENDLYDGLFQFVVLNDKLSSKNGPRKEQSTPPNLELTTRDQGGKIFKAHLEVLILETNFFFRMMHFKGSEFGDIIEKGKVVIEEIGDDELELWIHLIYTKTGRRYFNNDSIKKPDDNDDDEKYVGKIYRVFKTYVKLFCFLERFQEAKIMDIMLSEMKKDLLVGLNREEEKTGLTGTIFADNRRKKIYVMAIIVELGYMMNEKVVKVLGDLFKEAEVFSNLNEFVDVLEVSRVLQKDKM